MTKKEYLESQGFRWERSGYYLKEGFYYDLVISIERKNPFVMLKCYHNFYSDNDIKKLQIAFNNLKRAQEECMALPTYHRRKKAVDNH